MSVKVKLKIIVCKKGVTFRVNPGDQNKDHWRITP